MLSLWRVVLAVKRKRLNALTECLFCVRLHEHRGEGQVWLSEAHHSVGGNRFILANHQHDWCVVSNSSQDLDEIIGRKMTVGCVGAENGLKIGLFSAFQSTKRICHHCEC